MGQYEIALTVGRMVPCKVTCRKPCPLAFFRVLDGYFLAAEPLSFTVRKGVA